MKLITGLAVPLIAQSTAQATRSGRDSVSDQRPFEADLRLRFVFL
jgi:hypothetical protein